MVLPLRPEAAQVGQGLAEGALTALQAWASWYVYARVTRGNGYLGDPRSATVFLGGWNFIGVGLLVSAGLPWLGNILSIIYLLIKAWFLFFVMIWLRGAFPRLRVDQLMGFAWKFLLPLVLINIFSVALWVA